MSREFWREHMTPMDMQGKICLVTGSTRGLGKAIAFALANQHATVILGCRDRQSGEAVQAEIRAANPTAQGYETMFATNHLGSFLLTNLLLPRLEASPAARILTIGPPSTMKIAFDD